MLSVTEISTVDNAAFPSKEHDHAQCIENALNAAERICREGNLRLTGIRKRVLEIVWEHHAPIGAYHILEQLSEERGAAAPPTVYRALNFLLTHGLVHKIESLNAFVGCRKPDGAHTAQFLICIDCRRVAELDDPEVATLVSSKASRAGFSVSRQTIELQGSCKDCASRG